MRRLVLDDNVVGEAALEMVTTAVAGTPMECSLEENDVDGDEDGDAQWAAAAAAAAGAGEADNMKELASAIASMRIGISGKSA